MLKTVKIGQKEYDAVKTLAKKRGQLLQFVLNEAIRKYVDSQKAQAA